MVEKNKGVTEKVVNVFMWLYSLFIVFIIGYMVYLSLRERPDILSNTFGKPESFTFMNYVEMFVNQGFHNYFFNSLIILVLSVLLLIFLSSMVAYGLGRYQFRFNRPLRVFFLLGMMFPVQLSIVPLFLLMQDLNLINSFASVILILGTAISMPVFMLTEFFAKLPDELYEAAVLDGAGEFRIFLQIMFPLARPVVFSVVVITSVQIWNQFFIPLIFLQAEQKKTLPLLVVKYTNHLFNNIDMALAASVLSVLPILIIFIIFSRRILDGFTSGGIKG